MLVNKLVQRLKDHLDLMVRYIYIFLWVILSRCNIYHKNIFIWYF